VRSNGTPSWLFRHALRISVCGAAVGLLGLSGCATVQPYERERLAKADMQFERDADGSAGEEHATAYREGSSGGSSSKGGGCGCN
jgi:hypothetical protein